MADAGELEFLRRSLVEPGLLAPDRLESWRRGWPGSGSFFAHLVELGVLARADAGTLAAVFKGYLKLPPAGLLGLLRLEVEAPVTEAVAEVVEAPVPEDRSSQRPDVPVPEDRSSQRPDVPVPEDRPTERSGPHVPEDRSVEPGPGPVERPRREPSRDRASAGKSSPALRAAVAAAIDAALAGLPMEPSAGVPATPSRSGPPRVGDFLAGYRLRALLGEGARGPVYRAWAVAQGHSVVIKLMSTQGPGGLASAAAQAGLHGRVRHPGVLKVLAAGEQAGLGYLVFEDLYAVSLAESLTGAPLSPARVAQIGVEVASTLAAAAAAGVVHGDLKPAHLLVFSNELRVKLTDFLAPGEAPSSRVYLAPERQGSRRAPADVRGDMYSLGATLYHAATGHPPFARGAAAAQQLARFDFPGPLARVVARLMQEQPGERFASWDEVIDALLGAEPAAGRGLADPGDMSLRTAGDRA